MTVPASALIAATMLARASGRMATSSSPGTSVSFAQAVEAEANIRQTSAAIRAQVSREVWIMDLFPQVQTMEQSWDKRVNGSEERTGCLKDCQTASDAHGIKTHPGSSLWPDKELSTSHSL